MRILVAEDDEFLIGGLRWGLEHRGYAIDTVGSGREAAIALKEVGYDLLVLDLGLPGLDGLDLLKGLRQKGQTLPVLIITARDSIEDRIHGLDLGANDYLTKPFDFREFEARIRALLRKDVWGNRMEVACGLIRFVPDSREVFVSAASVDLTPREVAVLELLLQRAGRLVSKRQLIEQVAGWEDELSENAIEIVIHRLRRKLQAAGVRIRTVRGFGYMLEEL